MSLNFHVRHEVNPERVWLVLDAIASGTGYDHITQFDRQLSRLRQLGLVHRNEISLTSQGDEIHRIGTKRQEVLWEVLHFLHYSRWQATEPTEHTMFFTYREYCNLLYEQRNTNLSEQRDVLAAEMTSLISSSPYFADEMSQLAKGAVSLSNNSLIGVEHWIEKLSPEVINDGHFNVRHYCVPELLLMALAYVTEVTEAQLEIEQPLSDERREMLCQICFLENSALDQMLDWLYPEYPEIVQPGTSTGSYGRFVRLLQMPELKDLLR